MTVNYVEGVLRKNYRKLSTIQVQGAEGYKIKECVIRKKGILHYYNNASLSSLIGVAFVAGTLGYRTCAFVSLILYVADVTVPHRRFLEFSVSVTLMKLALSITDAPIAYWIHSSGFERVIWTTFALNYLGLKMTIHIMPESQATATQTTLRSLRLGDFLAWLRDLAAQKPVDATPDDDTSDKNNLVIEKKVSTCLSTVLFWRHSLIFF